jgi:hypothetical protein
MKIASKDKQRLLDRLTKARIRGLNIAVLRVILGYMQTHGVAFAAYSLYAQGSGYSERTVQRTIRIARDYLILDLASREGRPAIWCPELINWTPAEAVCFVDALTDGFRGCSRNGAKLATPTSPITPPPPPADVPAPSAATTADPVPSVTSTTDPAPSVATTTDPAHQVAASKLAPDLASKLASKLASDLAPLNPEEQNPRQKKPGYLPSPGSPPRRGGDDDAAGWRSTTRLPPASSAAHGLAVEIGKLCKLPTKTWEWPEHWRRKAPNIVQQWLSDYGWERTEIIRIVNHEMKTKPAPDSIRYFEKPIGRLYAGLAPQRAELAGNAKGAR